MTSIVLEGNPPHEQLPLSPTSTDGVLKNNYIQIKKLKNRFESLKKKRCSFLRIKPTHVIVQTKLLKKMVIL